MQRIDARTPGAQSAIDELRRKLAPSGDVVSEAGRRKTIEVFGEPLSPVQVVERICRDVQERGAEAALEYTTKLDGAALSADQLRVPAEELAAAHAAAEPEFLATLRRIRDNILRFQTAILHKDVRIETPGGGYLRQRYLPLERVGICVPGGAAAYPSTVLMTAVPAQAAGVKQLAVVAPPTKFGSYNQDLLATCHELGVSEVYRIGGAQAVAALAYGLKEPSPGRSSPGPAPRPPPKSRQDRRPRQPVRRAGQEARLRRRGYRLDCRAERGDCHRRRDHPPRSRGGRPAGPGGARARIGRARHLARAAAGRGFDGN